MKEDYKLEQEMHAYNRGVIAHINSLTVDDNPYACQATDGIFALSKCWLAGFKEKGSIKEKTK